MLEQCGACWLVGTADEVGWTVHFHRNLLSIVQSNERVNAVSGPFATMLFIHTGNAALGTDLLCNSGLQL